MAGAEAWPELIPPHPCSVSEQSWAALLMWWPWCGVSGGLGKACSAWNRRVYGLQERPPCPQAVARQGKSVRVSAMLRMHSCKSAARACQNALNFTVGSSSHPAGHAHSQLGAVGRCYSIFPEDP